MSNYDHIPKEFLERGLNAYIKNKLEGNDDLPTEILTFLNALYIDETNLYVCPFCKKAEASIIAAHTVSAFVKCNNCGATKSGPDRKRRDAIAAVIAWNDR